MTSLSPATLDGTAPLREMWYFAATGSALRPRRTVAKTILGEPLLLGRTDDGGVFALRDICPHRGIPLRHGRFDGQEVECCYHGWRFDRAGRCTAIPSLVEGQPLDPTRIRVKSYPAQERHGNVWVFFGDKPEAAPAVPALPDIGERGPDLFESVRLSSPIDHAVIGLMDPAHGPFVHRSWWWRSRKSIHAKAKSFAPSPWGFTMVRHRPSSNSRSYRILGEAQTEISFRLPSTRIEHISAGRHRLVNLTAITPLGPNETEINHAIYWTLPWLAPLRPLLRHMLVRPFLEQDRRIMAMQSEGLRHDPPLMLIDDADTQAKWYHRLKLEYLRAHAEGRPFVNPVQERVLHWRS